MSTLSIRLPDSLHKQIKVLAEQEGISINQFIATAAAEKMSALMTEEYLNARAQKASKTSFKKALSKVADIEAAPEDRF